MAAHHGSGRSGVGAAPMMGAVAGGLIGALIGVAVAVALCVSAWRDHPESASTGAADRLVETLRRQATKTWKVTGHFERRSEGRAALIDEAVTVAQRPPRRLSTQGGSAELVDGTNYTLCLAGADAPCASDRGPSFADRREAEIAGVRSLTQGLDPPYRVEVAPGDSSSRCFRMQRLDQHQAFDRYGDETRWCFDRATDALVFSEVRGGAVRDRFEATSVMGVVADSDFVIAGNTEP
jgi:hypothetical protein